MKTIVVRLFVFLFLLLYPFQVFSAIVQEAVVGTAHLFKTNFLFGVLPKQALTTTTLLPIVKLQPLESENKNSLPQTPEIPVLPTFPVTPDVQSPFQISARYVKATVPQIESLIQRYKEIPGGIVLEGAGLGIESIQKVTFDSQSNVFQINGDYSYSCAVSPEEMKAIAEALDKNDLLGISLGEQAFVYGNLTEGSFPSIYLQLADHFLGSVVFANQEALSSYAFPSGYLLQKNQETEGCFAVCFNLDRYQFKFTGKKLHSSSSDLSVTLIPLLTEKSAEGRFLPDFDKIQKGELPNAYQNNATHLVENITHYQKDFRIQKIIRYGETAAFLRALKTQGISLASLSNSL